MGHDGTNLFFPDPFRRKTTIPTSIGNNGRLDAIVISCGKLTQCRLEANIPYRSKCTFITTVILDISAISTVVKFLRYGGISAKCIF